MSVTFFAVQEPDRFEVQCSCGKAVHSETFVDYVNAAIAQATVPLKCGDEYCAAFPNSIVALLPYSEDVNVSNMNAIVLLGALGLDAEDLTGSLAAEDFLGRVMVAAALTPDQVKGNSTNNLPEGYVQSQLKRLQTIASWAHEHNKLIAWG